jgi:nucleotide-binding universal stress UspA family protein
MLARAGEHGSERIAEIAMQRKGGLVISIREVLFPTDLSPESDRAFEHARVLAERFAARLTLYHAVELPRHDYPHWAFAHDHEIWVRAEARARELLASRAESLNVTHSVLVEKRSSPHRAILELIRSTHPDLTVMATHGRGGISQLLLGSVTQQVVQHAFRPILCVREPDHGGPLAYRRILVPTDLSLASRLAFPIAASFARTFGAEVLGVHVAPGASVATLSGIPPVDRPVVPTETALWTFLQTDFAGLEVTAQIHNGPVWERIVRAAEVEKADLIVMSTRGHDSLTDRVLGSNTERVVRHAPCPVLVA